MPVQGGPQYKTKTKITVTVTVQDKAMTFTKYMIYVTEFWKITHIATFHN